MESSAEERDELQGGTEKGEAETYDSGKAICAVLSRPAKEPVRKKKDDECRWSDRPYDQHPCP